MSEMGKGSKEEKNAKKRGLISDKGREIDLIAKEDLPEMGVFIQDEQEAINLIQEVLSEFETRDQIIDAIIEAYDFQMMAENGDPFGYGDDFESTVDDMSDVNVELLAKEYDEYVASLSEEDKAKEAEFIENALKNEENERQQEIRSKNQGNENASNQSTAEKEFGEKESEIKSRLAEAKKKQQATTIFTELDAADKGRSVKARTDAKKALKEKYGDIVDKAKDINKNFDTYVEKLKAKGIITKVEC